MQDYYDKGMRLPEDIMILFCDDNWGNVRILPKKEDRDYVGGYGMYYHFDFVGGPVSYRWHNVTQIEKVWEQMNLAYQWGVEDLWIVNVGDIKPMELPISFFLDFAWEPEAIRADDLPGYYVTWASQQFGTQHAEAIADILAKHTRYTARRTPEMLSPETFSLTYYREAERVVEEYGELLAQSRELYAQLPETHHAAFYQLVLSPVELFHNLYEMYVAAGKNRLYASQGRASTNFYADKVKEHFFRDAELTREYHNDLADGKWNHMMSQTHIGYTSWNNPPYNKMPEVSYIQLPEVAALGYVVEHGKYPEWMRSGGDGLYASSFPAFDPFNQQRYYLEIFNQGQDPLNYRLRAEQDWIVLSAEEGSVRLEEKVYVRIDWEKVTKEEAAGEIVLTGPNREYRIQVPIRGGPAEAAGFVENNGIISIEAAHFASQQSGDGISWRVIPNLGRTESGLTIAPANADRQTPGEGAPWVEYEFTVFEEAELSVESYLSPTLNFMKNEGLEYAIAIDDAAPQIVNLHEGETIPDWEYPEWWNNSVTDHIKKKRSTHGVVSPGTHTLKIWMIDPGVVFQKFVLDLGGLRPSYLGPPESTRIPQTETR